jgi:hypothetical protein
LHQLQGINQASSFPFNWFLFLLIAVAFQPIATECSCIINWRAPSTQSCYAVNNQRLFTFSDVKNMITHAGFLLAFALKFFYRIAYGGLRKIDQNGET